METYTDRLSKKLEDLYNDQVPRERPSATHASVAYYESGSGASALLHFHDEGSGGCQC